MAFCRQCRRPGRVEDGYALLVIMVALSVFVITLAQAMPRWATQIRREREARTIDYARQYREGIKRYFHKNGRYPASLDVLVQRDASGLRYLRETWQDPLVPAGARGTSGTGSNGEQDVDGWQVIHFGQAVTAEIVDQPPASMASAAGGIAGPNLTGAPTTDATGQTPAPGATPIAPALGAAGPGAAGTGALGAGAMGAGTPPAGQPAGGGGGAVIGVSPLSKKPAVHAFNGFDIPNDWQFVYNYAQDPSLRGAAGATAGLPGVSSNGSGAPSTLPPQGLPPSNNVPPPGR
ncbi:MAG TPA: type II secretion system protein [Terriglobales bacterium]|jgi:type II secretory pathway pseudopilin PulG